MHRNTTGIVTTQKSTVANTSIPRTSRQRNHLQVRCNLGIRDQAASSRLAGNSKPFGYKNREGPTRGPSFSFAASLDERIKVQPVRSRHAPQERCAQLSCASKPGGFMQPSGARGAHKLLVRPRNARCKQKEQKNEASNIPLIHSRLPCGFLRQG
jgi:hypothetical protein